MERGVEYFGPGHGGYPGELFGGDFDARALDRSLGGGAEVAFCDIETCGLGDAPIFMVGVLRYRDGYLRFDSLLAEDPSREPELLRETTRRLAPAGRWVTFNGKSFDLPRLRKRARRHGLAVPECPLHLDLLQEVRRRWRGKWPDCRLSTAEKRLLGLERGPRDIPGGEVPERYWDYVRTGDRGWIEPVREHNRRDVLAMAALVSRLAEEGDLWPNAASPAR